MNILYYNDIDDIDDIFYDLLIETLTNSIMYNDTFIIPYDSTTTTTLNSSLNDVNPIKNVITDEVKNSLIQIPFKDAINKELNTICAITQDEFNEEDIIIQLQCNHCFNSEAILKWLTEEKNECPVCRYKLESKEKNSHCINQSSTITNQTTTNQTTTINQTTINQTIINQTIINPTIQYYFYY